MPHRNGDVLRLAMQEAVHPQFVWMLEYKIRKLP